MVSMNVLDDSPRLLLVPPHRRLLPRVEEVEEVVGYSPPLLHGKFRRADVEESVELAGVGVDDLPVQLLCDLQGESGLPRGGGPDDGEEGGCRRLQESLEVVAELAERHGASVALFHC